MGAAAQASIDFSSRISYFRFAGCWGLGLRGIKMGLRSSLTRLPWIRYTLDTLLYLTGNYFK